MNIKMTDSDSFRTKETYDNVPYAIKYFCNEVLIHL